MSLDVNFTQPMPDHFYNDVLQGLRQTPRSIPCKYLYDERGSMLFNSICMLEEYYPTRTEIKLLVRHAERIASLVGCGPRLVELGAGSGLKTQILLKHLEDVAAYVPVDISGTELDHCARTIRQEFTSLPVHPVCADYTADWSLPASRSGERTVFFYPGSTIGNFPRHQAHSFLQQLSAQAGPGGGLLIGVDMHKDPSILEAAYNDFAGVTAQFNLNLLRRINRELGANFNLDRFEHLAVYDRDERRIEMRLVSLCDQLVALPDETFRFREGEYIVTEHSHKYSIEDFADLAETAGWRARSFWSDEDQLFSLWYLEACTLH